MTGNWLTVDLLHLRVLRWRRLWRHGVMERCCLMHLLHLLRRRVVRHLRLLWWLLDHLLLVLLLVRLVRRNCGRLSALLALLLRRLPFALSLFLVLLLLALRFVVVLLPAVSADGPCSVREFPLLKRVSGAVHRHLYE